MQVFDELADGPVLTLDAVKNTLGFTDFVGDKCGDACPSAAFSAYEGKTTVHSMKITFGEEGSIDYKVTDASGGAEIISYSASGQFGSNST